MVLTFGEPSRVTSVRSLSFIARQQARMCWEFGGGAKGRHATLDHMLADLDVQWSVVCDERGTPVADFWRMPGAIMVFRAATTRVVRHSTASAFACGDRALWAAIKEAPDAPLDVDVEYDAYGSGDLGEGQHGSDVKHVTWAACRRRA